MMLHRFLHHAAHAELDDAPVVAGDAATARLPAVHPLPFRRVFAGDEDRRLRLHQVGFRREEVVVGRNRTAADARRRARMGPAARRRAEDRFDVERCTERLREVLEAAYA